MSKPTFSTIALLCFIALAAFGGEENCLKTAKMGDNVLFKTVTVTGGRTMEGQMMASVSKKTDSEVTVDVVTSLYGRELQSSYTVNLNEPLDPKAMSFKNKSGLTFKTIEKGEETLTIGGKALKTTWISYEATQKLANGTDTFKGKAWVCPDVPLGGLVKAETDMEALGKSSMELLSFGSGK